MDLEFYRGLHQTEFERENRLSTRFDAIVTVFTTLCGLLGFLILNFKAQPGGIVSQGFWVLVVLAGVALAVTVGFLIAASALPHLRDIDKPSEWRKYRKELDDKYAAGKGTAASAQAEFDDYLADIYVQATDANISRNTTRGYRLQHATYGLLAAFGLLVATFSTYYSTSMPATEPATEVTKMLAMKDAMICAPIAKPTVAEIGPPGTRPVPSPEPNPAPHPGDH